MSESIHQTEKTDSQKPLPPGQQLVAVGKWPFVGEREPMNTGHPWLLQIDGLVKQKKSFTLGQLAEFTQTELVTDIHCVTRWSKLAAPFNGVLLQDILEACGVLEDAKYVSFVARSERRHSSSLPLDQAIGLGTLLATHFEGQPLAADHGGPLRGVVPKKYFYKSVKWIEQIVLLAEDQPGYWEAETGYHNNADPWKEQRYIAASISKRDAAKLIDSRDFTQQDLLSIDVTGLDLNGLSAANALLRNARFENAQLEHADFTKANLSNASFRNARLHGASFQDADLEGADLAGADLRGANLSGCSLFGASFCDVDDVEGSFGITNAAKLDRETRIDRSSLDSLTEGQRFFIESFLNG